MSTKKSAKKPTPTRSKTMPVAPDVKKGPGNLKRTTPATTPAEDRPKSSIEQDAERATAHLDSTVQTAASDVAAAAKAQKKADAKAARDAKRAEMKAARDAKNAARKEQREAKKAERRAAREAAKVAKAGQLRPRDVFISKRDYFLATGSLPSGNTRWVFYADTRPEVMPAGPTPDGLSFSETGRFETVKAHAKAHYAKIGIRSVDLLPPAPQEVPVASGTGQSDAVATA